jgi:hypothetical protein
MSKKPTTTEQKQHIAALAASNTSPTAISRITKLHLQTVKKSLAEPATQEMIEIASKHLAAKLLDRADQIANAITPEDIEKAGLRDKAVSIGILQDKARGCYDLDKQSPLINLNVIAPVDLSKYFS